MGLSNAITKLAFQITSGSNYPISNQFMIGDYAAGNMMVPTQGLQTVTNYKTPNSTEETASPARTNDSWWPV